MGKSQVGVAAVLGLLALGCDNKDAESLARVARCAAAKGEAFAAETGGWQALQSNLDELPPETRVAARLHWDKALSDTQIQVVATDNGIELRGTVRNEGQRNRAVEIAESTTDVGKVSSTIEVVTPETR